MTFLHAGLALAGLACVSIPIIIHLLMRRRRRPIMWGAMRFLLEAYQKHRRRLMLEKWLLLLARCLLIALVGLAIGRPLLGALGRGAGAGRTVYLLVDNGLTGAAVGDDGRAAIDRHKEAARAVLGALHGEAGGGMAGVIGEGDRVALVALGGPADGVVLPASADVAAVSSLVDSLQPTQSRTDLAGALALVSSTVESEQRQKGARRSPGSTFVVVLSDYLEGSAELGSALSKLPEGVQLLSSAPADAGSSNVAITGLEPTRAVLLTGADSVSRGPGQTGASMAGDILVMLRRSGPAVSRAAATTLQVAMRSGAQPPTGGAPRPGAAPPAIGRTVVRWSAGQETATAAVQVAELGPPGAGTRRELEGTEILEASLDGVVSTGGGDSIAADNVWRRPVEVRQTLRVGVVAPRSFGQRDRVDRLDAAEWVRLALRPGDESNIDVVEIEPASLDGARLAGLDAVVLPRPDLVPEPTWARLKLFLDGGGLIFVMPPAAVTVHLWPDAMTRELGLDWKLVREARVFETPEKIAPIPSAAPSADAAGNAESSDASGAANLFFHIRGELPDLTRPVGVWRMLSMEDDAGAAGAAGAGQRLLSLAGGATLLWAGTPGARGDQSAGAPPPPAPPPSPPLSGSPPAPAGKPGPAGAPAEQASSNTQSRGLVVYLATALDLSWTDLPAKPLMVPLMHEVILQGVGRAHGSWWAVAGTRPMAPGRSIELRALAVGAPNAMRPRRPASAEEPTPGEDDAAVIPVDDSGAAARPLRRAGLWRAVDERGVTRGIVAVNPDTRASKTEAQPRAIVEQWLVGAAPDGKVLWLGDDGAPRTPDTPGGSGAIAASAAAILARRGEQAPISFPMLVAALAIAVLELGLARWASHADVAENRSGIRRGLGAGAPAPGAAGEAA